MRIIVLMVLCGLFQISCLKKIDEADSLNSNIFDPEYAGEKWYSIQEISSYTNSNNDLRVRIDYAISESTVPTIKPTGLSIMADCNQYPTVLDSAVRTYQGYYKGSLEYLPDGSGQYCINLGIYLWAEDTTINRFTECISL